MEELTEEEKKKERKERWKNILMWLGAGIFCVAIWWYGGEYMREYALAHAPKEAPYAVEGVFGDSFGAINALISALAFAGVIVTFWLQRKELDLQRQELRDQRKEFSQQNKTLKLQRFENTFFHMMELQQQIVNDLFIKVSEKENVWQDSSMTGGREMSEVIVDNSVRGRQAIHFIYKRSRSHAIYGIYREVYEKGMQGYIDAPYRDRLDHYFRHLYTILRYVDETKAFDYNEKDERDTQNEWEQKYHYATIVRATLARYEMLMLYYNGLSIFGREKLKPLIEKYAMLNNLDKFGLSLSKENMELIQLGTKEGDIWSKNAGLTGGDYEFYLTEEENNPTKYNIRAFGYREDELAAARQDIRKYNEMLKARGIRVER